MPSSQFVSGATAGANESLGASTSVSNAASGLSPFGVIPAGLGIPLTSRLPTLLLNLVGTYAPPVASAVAMPVSGGRLVLGALGAVGSFGNAEARNAAQGISLSGVAAKDVGTSRVTRLPGLVLNLAGTYAAPNALNAGCYFGGQIVASLTGIAPSAIGTVVVRGALSVAPPVGDLSQVSIPRVFTGLGGLVTLNMTIVTSSVIPTRLDFTPSSRPVPVAGFAGGFGTPSAVNSARGVYPGYIVGGVGTSRVSRLAPITLNLAGAYTPPNAQSIQLSLGGVGRLVEPAGMQGAIGNVSVVRTLNREVYPGSLPVCVFGTGVVWISTQFVGTPSINRLTFGTAEVINGTQFVVPSGFGTEFGTARAELAERTIFATGVDSVVFGAATSWYKVRRIYPDGQNWFIPGAARVGEGKQFVLPAGIVPGAFGLAAILRNEREVGAVGIEASYGSPWVQLAKRYILAREGTDSSVIGSAAIHNARQYVRPPFVQGESSFGTIWAVENRNRVVTTYSIIPGKIGRIERVENTAVLVGPTGTDTSLFGKPMVAYRIRTLTLGGFEEFFSRYNTVANKSVVIFPSGVPRGKVGVPSIPDRRQRLDAVSVFDTSSIGTAFAAYRVRSVDLTVHLGIRPPYSPGPSVGLHTQYFYANPIAPLFGVPFIEIHRNIIGAKGYPMGRHGEPGVRNVTPVVRPWTFISSEFGRAKIFNRTSHAYAEGFVGAAFGRAYTGHRTRSIKPAAWMSSKIPMLHDVGDDGPILPAQQYVLVGSLDTLGGFGAVKTYIPTVFPEGIRAPAIPRPTVDSNAIGPCFIQWDADQFGVPSVPFTIHVYPTPVEEKGANNSEQPTVTVLGEGDSYVGRPRTNPFTIYIDSSIFPIRIIDRYLAESGEQPGPTFWGNTSVTLGLRGVWPSWEYAESVMGNPAITLRNRIILVRGLKSLKTGIPYLPQGVIVKPYWGRLTEEDVPEGARPTDEYGTPTVGFPPDLTSRVYPSGMTTLFGNTQVDLFNRAIFVPSENDSTIYGTAFVHPPIHLYPEGVSMTSFGETTSWFRVRSVLHDSSLDVAEHWGVEFTGDKSDVVAPMTVRLVYKRVTVGGNYMGFFGQTYAGNRTQYAKPPGFGGNVSTVSIHKESVVSPGGFDSLRLGTPRRPVYGLVEAVGTDMGSFGNRAGLNLGVHVPYVSLGVAGVPNAVRGIRVTGMQTLFGDTVVVGESNCGSKLAVVATMGGLTRFGNIGVH